jgi:hypothetical protein
MCKTIPPPCGVTQRHVQTPGLLIRGFVTVPYSVNFAIENVPENQQNALIFIIKSKLVGKTRKFISSRQHREWNDIKDLQINHYSLQ